MPPGTGFHLHRLLRHAGLQWSYSNIPSRGEGKTNCLRYFDTSHGPHRKQRLQQLFVPAERLYLVVT
jgi:hypothetical protein